jgi:hypothetical protein
VAHCSVYRPVNSAHATLDVTHYQQQRVLASDRIKRQLPMRSNYVSPRGIAVPCKATMTPEIRPAFTLRRIDGIVFESIGRACWITACLGLVD